MAYYLLSNLGLGSRERELVARWTRNSQQSMLEYSQLLQDIKYTRNMRILVHYSGVSEPTTGQCLLKGYSKTYHALV